MPWKLSTIFETSEAQLGFEGLCTHPSHPGILFAMQPILILGELFHCHLNLNGFQPKVNLITYRLKQADR